MYRVESNQMKDVYAACSIPAEQLQSTSRLPWCQQTSEVWSRATAEGDPLPGGPGRGEGGGEGGVEGKHCAYKTTMGEEEKENL